MYAQDNSSVEQEVTVSAVENSDRSNSIVQSQELIVIDTESQLHVTDKADRTRRGQRIARSLSYGIIVIIAIFALWMVFKRERFGIPQIEPSDDQQQMQEAQNSQTQEQVELTLQKDVQSKLPRILWILTDRDINNSRLEPTFYGYHMDAYAQRSGFETRFVDHETAYRWLSQQTKDIITKAMHRRKYEVSVVEFLRIALIIQHGGVTIRPGRAILIEQFDWIQAVFQQQDTKRYPTILQCPFQNPPELFMFSEKSNYVDFYLAAQKNSSLLRKVFLEMADAVQFGKEKYPILKGIQVPDKVTNSFSLRNLFQTFFNFQIQANQRIIQCHSLKLQSIDVAKSTTRAQSCKKDIDFIIKSDKQIAIKHCGLRFMIETGSVEEKISKMFRNAIANGMTSIGKYHQSSIISSDFFKVDGIRQYLELIGKTREVLLCIVSLKTVPKKQAKKVIEESMQRLTSQSFSKWKAVYFTQEGQQQPSSNPQRSILTASKYEGLNLQTAITQHCPFKSIVFLLDFDEHLTFNQSLKELSQSLADRSVFGAFVPLQLNSTQIFPKNPTKIRRVQNHPNAQELQTIANHFRVFNSDYYRLISHNDLHNVDGEYYDRTIPLLGMLEMSLYMQRCLRENDVFQIKRMRQKIDFPEKRITLSFSIVANEYKKLDVRKHQYNFKFNYLPFCYMINLKDYSDNWLWLGDEMIVFNTGKEYQSPAQRQQMPKIIPRKIHQIWIYGEPSPAKKYMMNEVKRLHPEFEYFVWSKQNITVENFPHTFDIIQTLFEFDKASPYSKMSMISDFMRFEIIYQHGGFYFDTNYLWLGKGSLENWLSYDLVMSGQLYPRMYVYSSTSFFGSYPKNPRLLRLLNPECINRVRIYQKNAAIVSGPGYIKRIIRGQQQQNDPNTLKPSMEELYPVYPYDGMTKDNLCRKKTASLTSDMMFIDSGFGFSKNCSKLYPSAYGIDFYELGASWTKRRW